MLYIVAGHPTQISAALRRIAIVLLQAIAVSQHCSEETLRIHSTILCQMSGAGESPRLSWSAPNASRMPASKMS